MKYADESKSEFAEMIMRQHGFEPGVRSSTRRAPEVLKTIEQQKAESEAIQADMLKRHDMRWKDTWKLVPKKSEEAA